MLKIAHRGLSATNPDNSIESFVCAVEAGFDMIELDIQLCKNNEIVVFHDRSLYGKMIEEYTLHELEEIGVISLKTFFSVIDSKYIQIYLDLKGSVEIIDYLIDFILNNNKIVYLPNLSIASFNRKMIDILSNIETLLQIGFITSNNYSNKEWKELLRNVDFVSISFDVLDHETVDFLHKYGKPVYVYTCHNKAELDYVKKFNIDGIVSNIVIE
jgi:glycerophosphoryl diester phosphodiesterase